MHKSDERGPVQLHFLREDCWSRSKVFQCEMKFILACRVGALLVMTAGFCSRSFELALCCQLPGKLLKNVVARHIRNGAFRPSSV